MTTRRLIATMLIALGAVWLFVSLGLFSAALLAIILRLWPVLLIGVGLDILLKRRFFDLPYTALALVLLVLYGFAALPSQASVRLQRFSEPLGRTERAELELDLGSATTTLGRLTDAESLIEASLRDSGRLAFSVRGRAEKRISLTRRPRPLGERDDATRHWDIGLTRRIPFDIEVDGGSGSSHLDLSELQLSGLELDLGSGATTLRLPDAGARYEVDIEGGSGSLRVDIGDGADLTLGAELGSGPTEIGFGEVAYAELELEGGSGALSIDLPERSNVRVEIDDRGSGRLELPAWLVAVEDEDEGVWQTEGFDAERGQILLKLEDLGSGTVILR